MSGVEAFIRSFACRERLNARLDRFSALAQAFPGLRTGLDPDARLNWLSWRIGAWSTDDRFEYLNALLSHRLGEDGFQRNELGPKRWNSLAARHEYFSFLWMLQVAEMLVGDGWSLRWPGNGPDIEATAGPHKVHVECYVPSRIVDPVSAVEDVAREWRDRHLQGRQVELCYQRNLDNPIGQNARERGAIVECLLRQLSKVDPADVARACATCSQVELARWGETPGDPALPRLMLVVDGQGDERPSFRIPSHGEDNAHGDPRETAPVFLLKALKAKAYKNALEDHRPNAVAVNFLSIDAVEALGSWRSRGQSAPALTMPGSIDLAWFTTEGIHGLRRQGNEVIYCQLKAHPLLPALMRDLAPASIHPRTYTIIDVLRPSVS